MVTDGAISVLGLNETTNVARRAIQMSWADIHSFWYVIRGRMTVHSLAVEIHESELRLPPAVRVRCCWTNPVTACSPVSSVTLEISSSTSIAHSV